MADHQGSEATPGARRNVAVQVALVMGTRVLSELLSEALNANEALSVVDRFHDHKSALRFLSAARCDIVLIDINMQGAADFVRDVKSVTAIRVLPMSTPDDTTEVIEFIEAGVDGFAATDCAPEALADFILSSCRGTFPCDARVRTAMAQQIESNPSKKSVTDNVAKQLTERERQVLYGIARGQPNKCIANDLFISVSTVKNHVHNLLDKLCVKNRTEAATFARENGLI